MRFSKQSAAALALSLPLAFAQTSTSCNPTEQTCPQDTGLNAATFSSNFLAGKSALTGWTAAEGTTLNFGSNGAEFSISQAGQAPTISTDFYIFFGVITVKMQAAPGAGIVSSVVLLSDDLDEIDWEWLGGNTTTVETNFFGKGNTTLYDRAIYEDVSNPQTTTHTYTIDWNSERIEWIIDGNVVRTVTADNSLTLYGKNYPQTPMQLKLGNWCGGCSGEPEGTVQWAGGPTTFTDAPYVMYVESVSVQNTNPATSYQWMGTSGSWQSIKVLKNGSTPSGNSTAPTQSASSSAAQATNGTHSASTMQPSASVSTRVAYTTQNVPAGASPTANPATSSAPTASPSNVSGANSLASVAVYSLLTVFCGFLLL